MNTSINSTPWDGRPITKPGVYAGVPMSRYHAVDICDGPSLSSSQLRRLWSQSPLRFWHHSVFNPKRPPEKESEDKLLGSAAHHLICGEDDFTKRFMVRPDKVFDPSEGKFMPWNGNRKVCQSWLGAQKLAGRSVVTNEQLKAVRGMAVSIGQHPYAGDMLRGLIERSIFWRDAETGIWLKVRPDSIPNTSGDYGDLKTTESVEYQDLQASMHNWGYHQQGALVLEGALEVKLEINSFSNVWVEKSEPHCVSVKPIDDEDIIRGSKQNRVAIRKFEKCWKEQRWPAPGEDGDEERPLRLSDRAREYIDKRLERELK